jgi:hypothetical protein
MSLDVKQRVGSSMPFPFVCGRDHRNAAGKTPQRPTKHQGIYPGLFCRFHVPSFQAFQPSRSRASATAPRASRARTQPEEMISPSRHFNDSNTRVVKTPRARVWLLPDRARIGSPARTSDSPILRSPWRCRGRLGCRPGAGGWQPPPRPDTQCGPPPPSCPPPDTPGARRLLQRAAPRSPLL